MQKTKPARPSKRAVRQFGYYNLGGLAFFLIGYAVFALLYGAFGWLWWLAKIIADLTGWSSNYLVQRFLAFRDESQHHGESALLGRFTFVSLVNVPIDYAIVGGLKAVGVTPFLGLAISAGFFTIWKFAWYKHYVFKA